jgi:mRNA interferase HigB
VRVISKSRLREFWNLHPEAETRLAAWYQVVAGASWRTFADVRATFASADQVGRLVVFNVGGGNFRVSTRIRYERGMVYIRRVMTHKEYDSNDWKKDEWF